MGMQSSLGIGRVVEGTVLASIDMTGMVGMRAAVPLVAVIVAVLVVLGIRTTAVIDVTKAMPLLLNDDCWRHRRRSGGIDRCPLVCARALF
jgi:hypothetical protein